MIQINGVTLGEAQESALIKLLGECDGDACRHLGMTDGESDICLDLYAVLADARELRTKLQALA